MTYFSTSYFPQVDYKGSFDLQEKKEELHVSINVGYALLTPAVMAAALIAELFLSIRLAINYIQEKAISQKMNELAHFEDTKISEMAQARIEKLEQRFQKEKTLFLSSIDKLESTNTQDIDPHALKVLMQDFWKDEEAIRNTFFKEDVFDTMIAILTMDKFFKSCKRQYSQASLCEKLIESFARARRALLEKQAYVNDSGQLKHVNELREILSLRKSFSRLCCEIHIQRDKHYMYNMLILMIPLIGMTIVSRSNYTTKNSLMDSGLIGSYEETLNENPWLKPYEYSTHTKSETDRNSEDTNVKSSSSSLRYLPSKSEQWALILNPNQSN